ncbi:MAG: hypothetical protein H6752_11155 [Candidatus Omnitrophica bacterium]|nr:hypothetical protein [Candidatus Omnitrophota bacterium]
MFTQAKVFIIFLIGFFCFTSEPIQGEVLDADGDGVVGPHEVLELVRLWKQEATTGVSGNSWSLTGNSGTNPETNYIGTSDDQTLEIRVNGQRALRIEPNDDSPNIIGGYSGNSVQDNRYGCFVGGGGREGAPNSTTGVFSTIAGGDGNTAGSTSFVGGGLGNRALGYRSAICGGQFNEAYDFFSSVAGGVQNIASGRESFIGGGFYNVASSTQSIVCGGEFNTASGMNGVVLGGIRNLAAGDYSFAAGRKALARHDGAFVWADSTDENFESTTADQFSVRANGGSRFFSDGSNAALYVETTGTGRTGHFRITNPENNSSSVAASTQGGGDALLGYTIGSGNGVYGETAGSGWAGYFVGSGGSSKGVHIETNGGQGLEVVGGAKSAVVPTSQGRRALYTEEAAEVWFTDYGFGQLENGRAVISIDPLFAETVNLQEPYHVFVQLKDSRCEGVAVEDETTSSFAVVELRNGTSNAEFSYRIVAKRRGFEEVRLEDRSNL